MRRIVEFGCGPISHIGFQPDDVYLACDPLLDEMKANQQFTPPPDFVKSFIDNHALRTKAGRFLFTSRHERGIYYGEGWLSKCRKYKNPSDLRSNEIVEKSLVRCITLDQWLEAYEAYGFLESIDFMYCNMPIGVAPILESFSFCVKPEILMISSGDTLDVELFKRHGYTCLNTGKPFLAKKK